MTSPKTDRLIWLAISALWALMVGVPGAVLFITGLVNPHPDPEFGAISDLVLVVIGFFPLVIQAADVWQYRRLGTESDGEKRLREWESKKDDIINLFWGAVILAGLIWAVTENEDKIDDFFEERRAAKCRDLVEKVVVYDECEDSHGCTLSLQEFHEREELISEIGQECQTP